MSEKAGLPAAEGRYQLAGSLLRRDKIERKGVPQQPERYRPDLGSLFVNANFTVMESRYGESSGVKCKSFTCMTT